MLVEMSLLHPAVFRHWPSVCSGWETDLLKQPEMWQLLTQEDHK